MKKSDNFIYWNPGEPLPRKRPKFCEYYTEADRRWAIEHSPMSYWTILRRRWPKALGKAEAASKPAVVKPCKYEKILVELLKNTRIDNDTFGKPLIRFGSFFPTIDNPKLNRALMKLKKKHDNKTRPNVR